MNQPEPNQYALVTRAARFSWEAATDLLGTVQTSDPVLVDFPRRVQIVSVYPSVSPIGGLDTLPVPELDDLYVQIDVDTGQERRLTSRFDSTQNVGIGTQPSVTLGSYRDTVLGSRVLNWVFEQEKPTLTVTYSWKRPVAGGPYYQDVRVGLVFNCNYLEEQR